jgi:CBS domain-containing protein
VVVDQLIRIRPNDRTQLRLDQVALAVPPPYRATPEDPAASLLTRRPLGDEVVAVVLANGRVAGIVTVTDLRRAMRRIKLTPAGV